MVRQQGSWWGGRKDSRNGRVFGSHGNFGATLGLALLITRAITMLKNIFQVNSFFATNTHTGVSSVKVAG